MLATVQDDHVSAPTQTHAPEDAVARLSMDEVLLLRYNLGVGKQPLDLVSILGLAENQEKWMGMQAPAQPNSFNPSCKVYAHRQRLALELRFRGQPALTPQVGVWKGAKSIPQQVTLEVCMHCGVSHPKEGIPLYAHQARNLV